MFNQAKSPQSCRLVLYWLTRSMLMNSQVKIEKSVRNHYQKQICILHVLSPSANWFFQQVNLIHIQPNCCSFQVSPSKGSKIIIAKAKP